MKHLLLRSLIASLIISGSAVSAAESAPSSPGQKEEVETELTQEMEKMSRAFRRLRRQVNEPAKNPESLEALSILRQHTEASAKLVPQSIAALPASDRPKAIEAYRARIAEVLKEIEKVEASLKAGKNEAAATGVQSLIQMQKDGHREFRVDDE